MSINSKYLANAIISYLYSTNDDPKCAEYEYRNYIANTIKTITFDDLLTLDKLFQSAFYGEILTGIRQDDFYIPKMINFLSDAKCVPSENKNYNSLNLYANELTYLKSIIQISETLCDMFKIGIISASLDEANQKRLLMIQEDLWDMVNVSNYMAYILMNNPINYFEWKDTSNTITAA